MAHLGRMDIVYHQRPDGYECQLYQQTYPRHHITINSLIVDIGQYQI